VSLSAALGLLSAATRDALAARLRPASMWLRVLNEPTAAALATVSQNMSQRIAGLRLRRRHLDVTILQGRKRRLPSAGHRRGHLPGAGDMDSALLNILAELFNAEHGSTRATDQAARSRC